MFWHRSMKKMRTSPSLFDYCFITCYKNLKVFEELLKKVALFGRENLNIIDIGCGDKPFENYFSSHNYIGIDFKPKDTSVIEHDLSNRFPFDDNYFDVVILSEVLEHVPSPYFVLDEINRITKSNSLIFISTPFALQIHGAPFDFFRYTKYFYIRLTKIYKWEMINFATSNSIFSSFLLLFNQFSLFLKLPYFLICPVWFIINLIVLIIDGTLSILLSGKLKSKLFESFPLGYCAIFSKNKLINNI